MRRLAQFVRLLASRVCLRLSVRVCLASVHVKGSECVRLRLLASASRVCVRLLSRLYASVLRLCASLVCLLASVSRRSSYLASVCVSRLRLSASVCSRLRLCASVCVYSRQGFQMLASVCVCSRQGFRMRASVSRLCASMCVCVCVRLLMLKGSECSRLCASGVGRLVSRASVLVNACGNWLILCVGRHSKSLKGGGRFLLSSYYLSPCCTYRLYEQTFNILI